MNFNAILKCRNCKVRAGGTKTDGTVTLIRCPQCGVEVVGELANEMYLKQARYLAAKETYDQLFEDFKPIKSDFVSMRLTPGPALVEPDWEFFMEIEDQLDYSSLLT